MNNVNKVLDAYQIQATLVDQPTRNVYRITDGHKVYALKKSRLTEKTVSNWENVYHQAYGQHLAPILPIYLTERDKLYEKVGDIYYYLMPWLESNGLEQNKEIDRFYRSIGKIHALTKQSVSLDTQKVVKEFNNYRTYIGKMSEKLLHFVEKFEKNRYMSPFELLVCTQYRDINRIFHVLPDSIDRFNDMLQDDSDWNYCLCHGQLDFSHTIYHRETYIINWENAHFQNPVVDLASFFRNVVKNYDDPHEQLLTSFSTYLSENKLSEMELYLLSIYLLDPLDYIKILEVYENSQTVQPMIEQVKQLQHSYRKMMFALKWTEHRDTMLLTMEESED